MMREHRASVTRLSAAIPGAHSSMLDGSSIWWSGDEQMTARTVEFLRQVFADQDVPTAGPAGTLPSGTAVNLFTDIVDSTALTERLGDARFRDASRAPDAG